MTGPVAGADYSEEQLAVQRIARDFARKEAGPAAEERETCRHDRFSDWSELRLLRTARRSLRFQPGGRFFSE